MKTLKIVVLALGLLASLSGNTEAQCWQSDCQYQYLVDDCFTCRVSGYVNSITGPTTSLDCPWGQFKFTCTAKLFIPGEPDQVRSYWGCYSQPFPANICGNYGGRLVAHRCRDLTQDPTWKGWNAYWPTDPAAPTACREGSGVNPVICSGIDINNQCVSGWGDTQPKPKY